MPPRRSEMQESSWITAAAEAVAEVLPPAADAAAADAADVESGLPPSPTLIPAIKAGSGSVQLQAWPAHLELHSEPAFDGGSCSLGERQPAAAGRWGRWAGDGGGFKPWDNRQLCKLQHAKR